MAEPDESPHLFDLKMLFYHDPSDYEVQNIANGIVEKYGSGAMRRVNAALNNWRSNWDTRSIRDILDENSTFAGDPVRFWWLAKYFLVIHFFRGRIGKDDEIFPLVSYKLSTHDGMQIQWQVVNWLLRFRSRGQTEDCSGASFLSQIIRRSNIF